MEFAPIIRAPAAMDARIFADQPMGLRCTLLALPLSGRFQYDGEKNVLFLNFEKLEVSTLEDVEAIRHNVEKICEPIGHKVFAIVNYHDFELARSVEDAYLDMVRDVVARYYVGVSRYTTSSFMRAKLGAALEDRQTAPHIFESAQEAYASLGR
jgi:propionate CoA-transferase